MPYTLACRPSATALLRFKRHDKHNIRYPKRDFPPHPPAPRGEKRAERICTMQTKSHQQLICPDALSTGQLSNAAKALSNFRSTFSCAAATSFFSNFVSRLDRRVSTVASSRRTSFSSLSRFASFDFSTRFRNCLMCRPALLILTYLRVAHLVFEAVVEFGCAQPTLAISQRVIHAMRWTLGVERCSTTTPKPPPWLQPEPLE